MVPAHQPKERINTIAFTNLALKFGVDMSFHHATEALNAVLHRSEIKEIKQRTYQDICHRTGEDLSRELEMSRKRILTQYHFLPDTGEPEEGYTVPEEWCRESPNKSKTKEIRVAIRKINKNRPKSDEQILNPLTYMEKPETACYISIDDVGVKHQKEHRGSASEKHGVYVQNTVAKVESAGNSYILTGIGMKQVCMNALSCLLVQKCLNFTTLIFFTDGAKDIRANLEAVFGFRPYRIILDWYHLKKRCTECLSMSFQCKKENRKEILKKLLRILWVGNTAQAQTYLKDLDSGLLRSKNRVQELCQYIEKHSAEIPCYALRKELGLKISSNAGEKANDLVVAGRQKNNGMSWSIKGSGALAQIKAMMLNHEENVWLHEHRLPAFTPVA